jgi:hypothetical protein
MVTDNYRVAAAGIVVFSDKSATQLGLDAEQREKARAD